MTPMMRDMARFADLATASKDLDPTYPVLAAVHRARRLTQAEALWSSVLFVGWYRLASSLQVVPRHPSMPSANMLRLGTGVERRSLRTPENMWRHWRSVLDLCDRHGGLEQWLTAGFGPDPYANWGLLRENYGQAWGNGRWATYKLAEVLKEVNGLPVIPTDMGNDGSTGPVAGLHMLYGKPPALPKAERIRLYDRWGAGVQQQIDELGVSLSIAQVETVLCDFHSMVGGGYYVGHDIDMMQADLRRPEVPERIAREVFAARREVLPHDYLGEMRGWVGVDKARRRAYAATGRVLAR